MPFKSQDQRRKFYALKAQGKMDQRTIDEWESETPDEIPKRVTTKTGATAMTFWMGFDKRAAETYVQSAPPGAGEMGMAPGVIPPEKMLKWNEQGGVDPRSPEELDMAEAAGLKTLPLEIEGASCGNCVHFRALNPELGSGFCTNPQIKQDVTNRMLCSVWEHPGTYSAAEQMAEDAALQQQAAEQAAMAGQGVADGDPVAQNIMSDFQGGTGGNIGTQPPLEGAPPSAPAEGLPSEGMPPEESTPVDPAATAAPAAPQQPAPKKESKPKSSGKKSESGKSEGKGSNTINIHVGKEKVASPAFLTGFLRRV